MLTSSAKSKGRKLQQLVAKELLLIGEVFGLEKDDIVSRGMGQNGEDVVLSPAARKVFGDLRTECKNNESLNVTKEFWEHDVKYPNSQNILVSKRNHTEALVTLKLTHFMKLLGKALWTKNN